MPTDEAMLGFSNRWYAEAAASALRLPLPSGRVINLISAPAFLATKFEAFHTRGQADLMASHDFEDIVNVVEGRAAIVAESSTCPATLRAYLATQFGEVIQRADFRNTLPGLVAFDELHGQRVAAVLGKMTALAAL